MGEKCAGGETVKAIRLHIIAEGQTEERFVKDCLAEYLGRFQVITDVRCVKTGKDRNRVYKGGLTNYQKLKNDIVRWLREDQNSDARFTTMVDFYDLPKDFPGKESFEGLNDPYDKVEAAERAFAADIGDRRFIPYLQLHEFEALVLANPKNLGEEYFDREREIEELEAVLAGFNGNPELINSGRFTAPSKRIKVLIPEYRKVLAGPFLAELEGLSSLREKCRHFNAWIEKLSTLSTLA